MAEALSEERRRAFREVYTRLYRPGAIKRVWTEPVSCSSFHENRSAFHQYSQVGLVDEKMDDVELMDEVLSHAMPCLSCTCTPLYPEAKLFRPDKPTYVVSRHALDGWCPQNHMDCAAAAVAGAISAALGRKRGELDFIETLDVVAAMKRMAERDIASAIERMEKAQPSLDWKKAKKLIGKLIRHRPQPKTGDVRFEDFDMRAMLKELHKGVGRDADLLVALMDGALLRTVFHLCKLYAIEIMASHRNYPAVVREMGLGLKMIYKNGYTWEELKELVGAEGNGVVVFVPQHLVLVFATGEDENGGHRHVLVGRISGGQSPCSWIPFTQDDIIEGETGWVNHITDHGPADMPDPSTYKKTDVLTMAQGCSQRTLAVVSRSKKPQKVHDEEIPKWLLRDDNVCDSCMVDKARGDTKRHDLARRQWLGL